MRRLKSAAVAGEPFVGGDFGLPAESSSRRMFADCTEDVGAVAVNCFVGFRRLADKFAGSDSLCYRSFAQIPRS